MPKPANPRDTLDREVEMALQLRPTIARLARLLRQQDQTGFGLTLTAALGTIAAHGPMTLGEVAAHEQVAPPTITKVVEKLEAQGFVVRSADPTDRRVVRVSATAKAQRHLEATRVRRTEWLTQQLRKLSADELERLHDAIEVLTKLTAVPDAGSPS